MNQIIHEELAAMRALSSEPISTTDIGMLLTHASLVRHDVLKLLDAYEALQGAHAEQVETSAQLIDRCEELAKKLATATKALEFYAERVSAHQFDGAIAKQALAELKGQG